MLVLVQQLDVKRLCVFVDGAIVSPIILFVLIEHSKTEYAAALVSVLCLAPLKHWWTFDPWSRLGFWSLRASSLWSLITSWLCLAHWLWFSRGGGCLFFRRQLPLSSLRHLDRREEYLAQTQLVTLLLRIVLVESIVENASPCNCEVYLCPYVLFPVGEKVDVAL